MTTYNADVIETSLETTLSRTTSQKAVCNNFRKLKHNNYVRNFCQVTSRT